MDFDVASLASALHQGQVDKAGRPYTDHLAGVAGRLPLECDAALIEAAWLHDAVEDGKAALEDLAANGVSARALELVDALTRRPGEDYGAYLWRIKADPDAVAIKRADLADNMDPARLERLDPELAARLRAKYSAAWELLR